MSTGTSLSSRMRSRVCHPSISGIANPGGPDPAQRMGKGRRARFLRTRGHRNRPPQQLVQSGRMSSSSSTTSTEPRIEAGSDRKPSLVRGILDASYEFHTGRRLPSYVAERKQSSRNGEHRTHAAPAAPGTLRAPPPFFTSERSPLCVGGGARSARLCPRRRLGGPRRRRGPARPPRQVPDPGARREAARGSSREAPRAGRPESGSIFRLPGLAEADADRSRWSAPSAASGSASRMACRDPRRTAERRSSSTRPAPSSSSPLSAPGHARLAVATRHRRAAAAPARRLDHLRRGPRSHSTGRHPRRRRPGRDPRRPAVVAPRGGRARGASACGSTTPSFRSRTSSTRRWTTPLRSTSRARPRPRPVPWKPDHGGPTRRTWHHEHDTGAERDRLLPLDPGRGEHDSAAPPANPTGTGWVLDTAGGTGFPTGNWVFTITTDIPDATLVAGSAILNVGIWKGTIAGGVFTPTGTVLAPTDDPAAQNLRTSVNPITTNVTISVPRFALAASERLFVEFRRNQVAKINSNTATQRRLTFEVNAGANDQIAHPTADDVARQRDVDHGGDRRLLQRRTLYYKSDAAGSFCFSNALTDSGSGPYSTTFPAIGTTGWTHATGDGSDRPALRLDGLQLDAEPHEPGEPDARGHGRGAAERRTRSSRSSPTRVSRRACPPRSRRATSRALRPGHARQRQRHRLRRRRCVRHRRARRGAARQRRRNL